jgi:MFS family permease
LAIPRLLVNTTPLREYPEFRRLWLGYAISAIGTQLSVVAISYEVYHLTNSSLDVGLISLVQLGPAFLGSILGGSIADAMDRRRLLIITGVLMAACAAGMALDVSKPHPTLLPLFLLAGLSAGVAGVNGPALTAVLLSIVERDAMVAANALRQLLQQISVVLGPSLGGILIALAGAKVAFWGNAISFTVGIAAVITVGEHKPVGGATRFGLRSVAEGFKFLKGRQAIQGCFIADLNATVLGMPIALFPALAIHHFHGGSRTLGLLYAAPGIGAFVASALSGWTGRTRHPGKAVCIAIVIWGIAIVGFGLSDSIVLGVSLLALAGGADVISAVFRSTIIQTEAPDRLRGRISSIQQAVVTSGPRLGNTEAGLVAAVSSVEFSVVSGGIGCLVGIAIISHFMPRFVGYTLPTATVDDEPELVDPIDPIGAAEGPPAAS